MDKKFQQNFSVVNLGLNELPKVIEDTKSRYQWVPFGVFGHDDFFQAITLAHNTSTSTAACIEGIADLIYGKGLYSKKEELNTTIQKILPQEEVKRVAFDLKLYGNGAFQVYWDDAHEKIIKFYHVPVQYLRAEKIYNNPRIENYFYCTDWTEQRAVRNKKSIPAFKTSKEKCEILYIKNYSPGLYYYSLPDWVSALQYSFVEAELSNLHLNNIENGFLPAVLLNFNNGSPAPEERQTIEDLVQAKFTGTNNAGRFMMSFNDDPSTKPTIDKIETDNLHEKYEYVAKYAQDRILVAHRVTSPLLFGIRTEANGFSSQSEEMMTAFSILQTMTISPFQNTILNALDEALNEGGYEDSELYFDQLTPLAILSQQAEDTDKTIDQVSNDTNKELENPATTEDSGDQTTIDENRPSPGDRGLRGPSGPGEGTTIVNASEVIHQSNPLFKSQYEIYK
jgi:capsid portal protein